MTDGTDTQAFYYRDQQFLQYNRLTIRNLLTHYFTNAPFYDNDNCLNERCITSQKDITSTFGVEGISYRLTYVKTDAIELNGYEKIYVPENYDIPIDIGFAVVSKYRTTATTEEVLAKYYLIDGTVYQSPDLYSLVSSSIRDSIFHIREAMRELHSIFKWDVDTGYRLINTKEYEDAPYLFDEKEYQTITNESIVESRDQNFLVQMLQSYL